MTSIGETLRRQRQKRNLELPKIAGELKISARFLQAMEQDDFAKLPGGVFTKSFVRQYASFLGLDAEELVAEMERSAEPALDVVQLGDKPKPDVPGIALQMGDGNWQSVRERHSPMPSWIKAGVLLVVLMLVCSGIYYWSQRPRRQAPFHAHEAQPSHKSMPITQPSPPPRPAVNPPVSAPIQAAVEPVADKSPAPSAPAPAAATPDVPSAPANPNASVRVGITAVEAVWIRAVVNGKSQFEGVLQAHETRNIDGDGEVTLRLGNAGGATLTWNGKPVGAVGPKGQVRTIQFTSGGFQIVADVPKPLEPLDRL